MPRGNLRVQNLLRMLPVAGGAAAMLLLAVIAGGRAEVPPNEPAVEGATVPGFWDPNRRPERPDLPQGVTLRFLTETNYQPFNYAGAGGAPAGLNVDLARLICEQLRAACTIQMRRFDGLLPALADGQGDAVIASLAATPEARRLADFSDPYYRTPARFVARKGGESGPLLPEKMQGVRVGVTQGTRHEAYLRALFTEAVVVPYPDDDAARKALQAGEIALLFSDAIKLAFWLNGTDSADCCTFRGGLYSESRYFGEGVGIAVRRGNDPLRRALNWSLYQVWESGRHTELWLRHFPISPF